MWGESFNNPHKFKGQRKTIMEMIRNEIFTLFAVINKLDIKR